MTEYIHLDAISPRAVVLFVIAIGAGYFLFKATKHLLFGLVFTAIGLVGVGYLTGILTLEKTQAAAEALKAEAGEGFDAASARAKLIGEKAYDTSAGKAGAANEAFKKNLEGK